MVAPDKYKQPKGDDALPKPVEDIMNIVGGSANTPTEKRLAE